MTGCSVSPERHSTTLYTSDDALDWRLEGIVLDHQNKDMLVFEGDGISDSRADTGDSKNWAAQVSGRREELTLRALFAGAARRKGGSGMSDKAVITCSLNGVLTDPKQHHVPVTPEEMARDERVKAVYLGEIADV